MHYTRNITDYETGEVHRISIGEHLTITETAQLFKVGRKALTDTLLKMGICQREYDVVAEKKRIRLHPEAAGKGLGYRILGKHGPFDVLSPVCIEIVEPELRIHLASISPIRWKPAFESLITYERERVANNMSKLDPQMKVSWLMDHCGKIPVEIIADGIGVGRSLVYRYLDYRESQLEGKMHVFQSRPQDRTAEYYGFCSEV